MVYGRRKPVVAVIEDDAALREVLEWLLSGAEYEVVTHESAESFLEWRGPRAECLVADIRLPGLNGFELLRKLARAGNRIPTIFISAFDSVESRDEARATGAAYLKKPFDSASLIRAIEEALETALSHSFQSD